MNIFVLDEDVKKCAEYSCDKHVVKMLLESVQLLCSTYYYTDEIPNDVYKLAHKNHPCSIWTRESLSNWKWLYSLATELYKEYKYRYGDKIHKSGEMLNSLPLPKIKDIGITKRPQCMPLEYQQLDVIDAYRGYYLGDKRELLKYKRREIPYWVK
jgi:hypothetical protein